MKMKLKLRSAARLVSALVLGAAALAPGLLTNKAFAITQVDDRSITMSTSAADASGVTYLVGFTTHQTISSLVLDFCSESPIISSTCSTPTGFTAASATLVSSGGNVLNNWTITRTAHTVKVLLGTGTAFDPAALTFTLGAIHNPTSAGTFYARVYTYATADAAAYTSATSVGTHLEEGGFALAATNQVSVAGTVQESLTFCVSGDETTSDGCATPSTPSLTLGTGTPKVLDANNAYTGDVFSQISTNAANGATIRMRNSNSCGGLSRDNGTTCDIAATGTTPSALSSGSGFGMKAASDDAALTTADPYKTANYGMDTTTSNNNVTSTYGSAIASSTDILDAVNTTYTFAARAANTTPAGLYTATMTLIATGTY